MEKDKDQLCWGEGHAVGEASGRDLAETQDQSEIQARAIHHGGGGPGGPDAEMAAQVARVPIACGAGGPPPPSRPWLRPGVRLQRPGPCDPCCLGGQGVAVRGLGWGTPSTRALYCFLPSAGGLHAQPNTEPCQEVGVGPPKSPCPWWGQPRATPHSHDQGFPQELAQRGVIGPARPGLHHSARKIPAADGPLTPWSDSAAPGASPHLGPLLSTANGTGPRGEASGG